MESLNSAGGHIAVSLVLIFSGMGAAYVGIPHGNELVVFSLGVLSRSMYTTSGEKNDLPKS